MKRYILVMLGFLLFNTPVFPQNDSIKVYPENDYVYYLDAAFQQDTDEKWNKSTNGSFYLPYINVDNEDIQKLNQALEILYYTYYPCAVNQNNNLEKRYILEAKQFINQNVLTVLIKFYYYNDVYSYDRSDFILMPVSFDLNENRLLSQTKILELSGYTLDEVVDIIIKKTELMGHVIYVNGVTNDFDPTAYAWYKVVSLREYSLNPLNVPRNIQLFIDDNKNLNVLVPMYKIETGPNIIHHYESFILPIKEESK